MRARKKKNTVPRLERVADFFVPSIVPEPGREVRVEVGCGKGKFITAMAKDHPEISFFALEKIPDVIVMAAEKAAREGIGNLRFLLGDAKDLTEGVDRVFRGMKDGEPVLEDVPHAALCPPHAVKVLYLNFSDPYPNKKHAPRRLTHRDFLEKYRTVLTEDGHIEFKTDNRDLFFFSVEEFKACGYEIYDYTEDLHHSGIENPYVTEYEERFSSQGFPIYALKAKSGGGSI